MDAQVVVDIITESNLKNKTENKTCVFFVGESPHNIRKTEDCKDFFRKVQLCMLCEKITWVNPLPAASESSAALSACAFPLLPAGLKSHKARLDLVPMLQIKLWFTRDLEIYFDLDISFAKSHLVILREWVTMTVINISKVGECRRLLRITMN